MSYLGQSETGNCKHIWCAASQMADNDERPKQTDKPRKRRRNVSKVEIRKKQKRTNHTTGKSCNCKRFKCFQATSLAERAEIIAHFNSLGTKNEQHSYLSSLITVNEIKRRRNRKPECEANFHEHAYKYHVSVVRDDKLQKVPVCATAFHAIFGITRAITERIKNALTTTGN